MAAEKLNREEDSRVKTRAAMPVGKGSRRCRICCSEFWNLERAYSIIRKITAQTTTCLSCRKYQVAVDKKGGEEHVVI